MKWRMPDGLEVADWFPHGAGHVLASDLEAGHLIGMPFTPWRVIDTTTRDDGTVVLVVRAAHLPWPDVNTHRTDDLHLPVTRHGYLPRLPDRYPVCSCCGQLMPCQQQWAETVAEASAAQLDRHTVPGVCPACGEVVSHRQGRVVFPHNLYLPGGPQVVFHTRRRCVYSAILYEDRYAAQHPDWPRRWPTCAGATIVHADGSYTCSAGPDACPGSHARHNVMSVCRDPDCEARCRGNVLSCTPRRGMVWRDAP